MITGIRYFSTVEPSGYGLSANSYILGLARSGTSVSWMPLIWTGNQYGPVAAEHLSEWLSQHPNINPELRDLIHKPIQYSHVVLHTVPEYWHRFMEKDKVNVGYTAWETDLLPAHWPTILEKMDDVLVPSTFNQQVFSRCNRKLSVRAIPHIAELHPALALAQLQDFREKYQINPDNRLFYTINAWNGRKNLGYLLHAYLLAFTNVDNVSLVIKTSKMGDRHTKSRTKEPVRKIVSTILGNYDNPANVILIDDDGLSDKEISILHEIGDVFVSLTHGEGWGMGTAYAASIGNPVIITGWGGQMDYIPKNYPGVLDYSLEPVIFKPGMPSYSPDQNWARADFDQAIEKMQDVHQNYHVWEKSAAVLKDEHKKFSMENISQQFLEALSETHP
jgi:glycosyltransferase involved in cell wall biosynthesis